MFTLSSTHKKLMEEYKAGIHNRLDDVLLDLREIDRVLNGILEEPVSELTQNQTGTYIDSNVVLLNGIDSLTTLILSQLQELGKQVVQLKQEKEELTEASKAKAKPKKEETPKQQKKTTKRKKVTKNPLHTTVKMPKDFIPN